MCFRSPRSLVTDATWADLLLSIPFLCVPKNREANDIGRVGRDAVLQLSVPIH